MPASPFPAKETDDAGPSNPTLAIFLISVLSLFLEMMLIRWIGTEVRIFAYLQNTILVVCFLGLGLGCFTSHQAIELRKTLFALFFLVFILAIPISRKGLGKISEMLSSMHDFVIFYSGITDNTLQFVFYVFLSLSLIYCLTFLILDVFVPVGRLMGRLIDNHPNTIWAYSVNVTGSLIGTWLFVLLSVLCQPPLVWCLTGGVLLLFIIGKPRRVRSIEYLTVLGIVILSWFASIEYDSMEVIWSPYQKITFREADQAKGEIGRYWLNVNNVLHQEIVEFSSSSQGINAKEGPLGSNDFNQYSIQLLLHPSPKKMLIVGAGTGNDVAAALRHGVKEITAVEIDPAILSLGRRYHPNQPYSSSSVKIINDDARSFFATCKDRFDVISFGLLDSHTSVVLTNTRLDHYVFSRESIKRARTLLADGGIICLHSSAPRFFIADRLANVLRDVFNQEPISFVIPENIYGYGGIMFVVGDIDSVKHEIDGNTQLKSVIEKWQQRYPLKFSYSTPITTDDWPYLYLEKAKIPVLYYLLVGLMVLLVIRSRRRWKATGLMTGWKIWHCHFFLLGAAFMLLEVQNISKASVALGSTWWVNAVIISGVLFMILLSNIIAAKLPRMSLAPVYVLLCSTCVLLYFVDIAQFAFLPFVVKAIIVGGLTTLPMVFSGIVFIRSFADADRKDEALGANLMGALVGALLQSITFITGIRALLIIVTGLYLLAVLTRPGARNSNLSGRERTF